MRWTFGRWCVVLAAMLLASCDDEEVSLGPSSTVETVAVIPGVFSLVVGDTLRLVTIARGEVGNPIDRPVVWSTSSQSVVTVSSTGLATAVGGGAATITATVEGSTGTAAVTISPRFPPAAFVSVTAGGAHTCGLTATGVAYCWGRGESGQLGVPPPLTNCLTDFGGFPCALVPFLVDGGRSFVQLTAGESHTCGLMSDGSAWCWGNNANGQLGDASLISRNAPVAVATSLRFTRIEAGVAHTCGLTSGGAGWCWGRNNLGQLGDGTTVTRSTPVQVAIPAGLTSQELAPGEDFTCALASNGTTYCWGSNHRGQLGRGTHDQDPHPDLAPLSGNLTFTSIAVGLGSHACGLTSTGAAYCWGGNGAGELGDGSVATSFFPVAVSGGIAFEKLEIGGSIESGITCGLTSAADAYCWGYNRFGQVGAGSTARDIRTPVVVAGGRQYESVSVGMLHACGLTISGTLYCWGSGRVGQLGVNYTTTSAVPLKVAGQP